MPKVSLIISFYKNTRFLRFILTALQNQTFNDFEVIISDDGSPQEMGSEIKKWLTNEGFNFQYIWHEDDGFKKTKILNKSVIAAKANYLVFLDGDCIPHKKFIKEHYLARQQGIVRAGRRVNLSKRTSDQLTTEKIRKGYLGRPVLLDLFSDSFKIGFKGLEQGIYIKSALIRRRINQKYRGLYGHNFSMYKSDLLAVNGFDERFVKPGVGEDTDLESRLRRSGIKIMGITKQAIVYHEHHKLLERESDIYDIYHLNNREEITYTPYGINKAIKS